MIHLEVHWEMFRGNIFSEVTNADNQQALKLAFYGGVVSCLNELGPTMDKETFDVLYKECQEFMESLNEN